jgi:protoporphyrinogen oxidase
MSTQQSGGFPFEDIIQRTLETFNPGYWQRFFSPNITNIFGNNTEDIDTEKHVLQEVGSYGKQLGIIIKMLDIWVDHDLPSKLTPEEQLAVAEFRSLSHGVQKAVEAIEGPKWIRMTTAMDKLTASVEEIATEVSKAERETHDDSHR